ncbi:hypothetical protein B7P43_G05501, partial [Cryptotermes secundus]
EFRGLLVCIYRSPYTDVHIYLDKLETLVDRVCEGDGHSLLRCSRVYLAKFLEPGQTINAARYVHTLHKLHRALRDKRPGRNMIILHDNAHPHAARLTLEAIAKMGWEVLPHPSYSTDLAPFDYHVFRFVKDQLHGQRSETREAIQKAVHQCLWMDGTKFYRRGIFKLPERWEKCVQRSGD